MKKKGFIFCIFILVMVLITIAKTKNQPVITYYPPANPEDASFTETKTSLHVHQNKFIIQSISKSNMPLFLRQDVSFTFHNGKLMSLLHRWEEKTDEIQLKEEFPITDNGLYEAITFHFGEFHQTNDSIKSIQNMTNNWMYVHKNKSNITTFKDVSSTREKHLKKKFDQASSKELNQQLEKMTNHFNVNLDEYTAIPVTGLSTYTKQPIPNLSQSETDKIIGQLWEGLYKNYAIPIVNQQQQADNSLPFILFSKDSSHLIVLFEINGEFRQLIQKYS